MADKLEESKTELMAVVVVVIVLLCTECRDRGQDPKRRRAS